MEVDVEEVRKGFESDDMTADVRSNVNCRVLSGECCATAYEVDLLSIALPIDHAPIHGEEVDEEDESSLHVVPIYCQVATPQLTF